MTSCLPVRRHFVRLGQHHKVAQLRSAESCAVFCRLLADSASTVDREVAVHALILQATYLVSWGMLSGDGVNGVCGAVAPGTAADGEHHEAKPCTAAQVLATAEHQLQLLEVRVLTTVLLAVAVHRHATSSCSDRFVLHTLSVACIQRPAVGLCPAFVGAVALVQQAGGRSQFVWLSA